MAQPDFRTLLSLAHHLADTARGIALHHFRTLDDVHVKDDLTPVTVADREIERTLRRQITAAHPDHGVLGEEEGADRIGADLVWVIDPIDGTKSFASGNPMFGTLIGLVHEGVPVLGILEAPALGERWTGAPGSHARHQDRPIRTRLPRALKDAVMYCTTPEFGPSAPGFVALRDSVCWTTYGGDCIAYGLVAMGGADLVVDRDLKPHDWCALVPILREAGGVMVDWQGRDLTLDAEGDVVAASSATLAEAAIAVLADGMS